MSDRDDFETAAVDFEAFMDGGLEVVAELMALATKRHVYTVRDQWGLWQVYPWYEHLARGTHQDSEATKWKRFIKERFG